MTAYFTESNCGSIVSPCIRRKFRFVEVDDPQKGDIILIKWGKNYYSHVGIFVDEFSFRHGWTGVPTHVSKYHLYRKYEHKIVRLL